MKQGSICKDLLFGLVVGDALGVPVEFLSRNTIQLDPVTDMRGFGTYHLPPGTFSDDSSLSFCLAEALTKEFNLQNIANNFSAWLSKSYWTAGGNVFDVGNTTWRAIRRFEKGSEPALAGGFDEEDNGNGSLMRILPLVIYIKDKPIEERFQITRQVSAITHGHIRSCIACFYYLEFARLLILKKEKFEIYQSLRSVVSNFLNEQSISSSEINIFKRLLKEDIYDLPTDAIFSSGYVLHTLEASIWCLLTTNNYKDAVLKAVNLGQDTDTTGTVTGGLAGLLYGHESIPTNWIEQILRNRDIEDLANRLERYIYKEE